MTPEQFGVFFDDYLSWDYELPVDYLEDALNLLHAVIGYLFEFATHPQWGEATEPPDLEMTRNLL